MSKHETWVDNNLIQQLQGRKTQPGVINLNMGSDIVLRLEQMAGQLPLVQALGQRWQSVLMAQEDHPPFVYARPAPAEPKAQNFSQPSQTVKPIVVSPKKIVPQPPTIQSKFPVNKPKSKPATVGGQTETGSAPKTRSIPDLPKQPINVPPPAGQPQGSTQTDKTAGLPSQKARPQAAVPRIKNETTQPVLSGVSDTLLPLPLATAKGQNQPGPKTAAAAPLPVPTAHSKPAAAPPATPPSEEEQSLPVVRAKQPGSQKRGEPVAGNPQAAPLSSPVSPARPKEIPQSTGKTPNRVAAGSIPNPHHSPPAMPVVKPRRSAAPKASISWPAPPVVKSMNDDHAKETNLSASFKPLPVVRPTSIALKQGPTSLPLPTAKASGPASTQNPATPPRPAPLSRGSATGSNVIQRKENDTFSESETPNSPAVNVSEIVEEVQRQFMRQLAIEGERRGATSWR